MLTSVITWLWWILDPDWSVTAFKGLLFLYNKLLLEKLFQLGSSISDEGSRPVILINRKKSGVCASIICSLCFVKRWSDRLRMEVFNELINVTVSGTSAGLGVYSEDRAHSRLSWEQRGSFKRVWLSEGEGPVSFACVEWLTESRHSAVSLVAVSLNCADLSCW